eukprot:TRINITY_DN6184_c1_g1_i11.p1 TRINITY_DN6184_c1_g1~~TRINITY_DN6184_c1_g1_i11.p1  ORF type:complete len:396 (+),score=19.36 TRINITY_DN6184_c1_g1_i11:80-1267(+)
MSLTQSTTVIFQPEYLFLPHSKGFVVFNIKLKQVPLMGYKIYVVVLLLCSCIDGQVVQPHNRRAQAQSFNKHSLRDTLSTPHIGNNHQLRQYTCYEPVQGLSTPVVTIVTTVGGGYESQILDAVQNNRISYAMANRYRYCEMSEKADVRRDWSYQRFPISLAVLPCTDFLVYMDADALFVNPSYDFSPYYQQMDDLDIDILLSKDYFPNSPVQFGVYMVRNVDWIYNMFEEVYNLCTCDWDRMTNWPREQGMIFDYIQYKQWVDAEFKQNNRTRIISFEGWNTQANQISPKLSTKRFIQHYAGCCYNTTINDFEYEKRWNITLDNIQEFEFHKYVFPKSEIMVRQNFCHNIYSKELISVNQYRDEGSYKFADQSVLNLMMSDEGQFESVEIFQIL